MSYLFAHSWSGELERLDALASILDPGTFSLLDRIGLGSGWRCLEVGAGAGSVASFMADRAGPAGRVVATDLDTGFLDCLGLSGVEVRRHDVVADSLEESAFDLVHARLLLEHLRDWRVALERMAMALAPGGWIVVEALEWTATSFASASPDSPVRRLERLAPTLSRLLVEALRPAGIEVRLGHRLPAELVRLGLDEVRGEGRAPVLRGGSPEMRVAHLTLARFEALLADPTPVLRNAPRWLPVVAALRSRPVRQMVSRAVGHLGGIVEDPGVWCTGPLVVAGIGRRPA